MSWLFEVNNEDDFYGILILIFTIAGIVFSGLVTFGLYVPTGYWGEATRLFAPVSFISGLVGLPVVIWIIWDEKKDQMNDKQKI